MPEVSLITSWAASPVCSPDLPPYKQPVLLGMAEALRQGIHLLDLYFLNHFDIPWYSTAAKRSELETPTEPHKFVSSLTTSELQQIARELRKYLAEWYEGRLVGRRPRLASFATFFPDISSEDEERRHRAVRAIRNAVYLAGALGAHCVEIVGGSGVPTPDYDGLESPENYRNIRWRALVKSINEIYTIDAAIDDSLARLKKDKGNLPYLAIELEPGTPFLLGDLMAFKKLYEDVKVEAESPKE